MSTLKIIPYYTGKKNLQEILGDKNSLSILWLEILLNDSFDWEDHLDIEHVRTAYEKACIWYGNFKNLIEYLINRKPLKIKKGKIDNKEYRKFIEALNFVST